MKALSALCSTGGASVPPTIVNGRVGNAAARQHRRSDSENAEIQMYLSKLKDLVPFMPKNRKLSKLEVIQHVIDYICDLQLALETHPMAGGQNATPFEDYLNNNGGLNGHKVEDSLMDSLSAVVNGGQTHSSSRQPLGVRPTSSNQIVEPNHQQQQMTGTDLMFLQQINNSNVSWDGSEELIRNGGGGVNFQR